jgi:hypothetical protein
VIGVGYDSVDKRVYWTDVKLGKETIESVTTDGHNRRVVLSTGLGMPEDLVVDETSRNIYFRSVCYLKGVSRMKKFVLVFFCSHFLSIALLLIKNLCIALVKST